MIKIESLKNAVIISTLLNVVAKLIAFINTIIITYYFGTQPDSDIYFYIITVATLLCSSINGIDLLVLVPEIMRLKSNSTESQIMHFVNFFLFLYILLGGIIALFILISPTEFYAMFSKFESGKIGKYTHLLQLGSGIIWFQLVNNLLTSLLTSYRFFIVPMIATIINSCLAIISTFLYHNSLGIKASLIGVLIGSLLNFLLLILLMRFKLNWDFFKVSVMKSRRVWKNIGLMQINLLPVWLRGYVTIVLFSSMSAGTITALNIAQNIAAIPEIFITSQVLSIIGIRFSELNAINSFQELKDLKDKVLVGLFIIIIPIAIIFGICAKDIVALLYLRGDFDIASLNLTSFCLIFLSLLMPFKIPDTLFTRIFTSMQLYRVTVFFGAIAHIIIAMLTYFLTIFMGLKGYFIALLLGYCIIMPFVFYLIIKLKAPTLKSNTLLSNLVRIIVISVGVFFITFHLYGYICFMPLLNVITVSIIVFTLFFISIHYLLNHSFIKAYTNKFFYFSKK